MNLKQSEYNFHSLKKSFTANIRWSGSAFCIYYPLPNFFYFLTESDSARSNACVSVSRNDDEQPQLLRHISLLLYITNRISSVTVVTGGCCKGVGEEMQPGKVPGSLEDAIRTLGGLHRGEGS